MSFRSGSISYALFRVSSSGAEAPPTSAADAASLLGRLAEHTLTVSGIGEPRPMEFGWCGGRHVLDEVFEPEHVVFEDGLLFGLRVDVNRIPGEIRRAYLAQAQQAMATDGQPYLSKREKAAAKEEAEQRCREDLAAGKYRRSKMVEVLWDVERGVVLAPAFGDGVVGGLRDLFFETFDLRLSPLSSGALAFDVLSKRGRLRDYEELKPSVFTPPPPGVNEGDGVDKGGEGGSSGRPNVPWAHVSPEPSDFVGNEFLLWLLWQVVEHGGEIRTEAGDVAVVIERVLDMECPWGVTGKQGLVCTGPAQSPEARRGLLSGKWPRKAGLLIALDGEQWSCTLQADRLLVTGLKPPAPEEAPGSPRELIEQRLSSLRRFDEVLGGRGLFGRFLEDRAGSAWSTPRQKIAGWIRGERPGAGPRGGDVAVIETKPAAGVRERV